MNCIYNLQYFCLFASLICFFIIIIFSIYASTHAFSTYIDFNFIDASGTEEGIPYIMAMIVEDHRGGSMQLMSLGTPRLIEVIRRRM